jgi:hypothetical protein
LIPSEKDKKQRKESRIPSKPIISNPHFFALNKNSLKEPAPAAAGETRFLLCVNLNSAVSELRRVGSSCFFFFSENWERNRPF